MSRLGYAVLLAASFVLPVPPWALAHGTGGHAAAPATAAAPAGEADTELAVTIDPGAAAAQVVRVRRGAHVHLTISGAGAHALHLHGYDIAVRGPEDGPVAIVFDADHAGRFPVEMHVEDDLLGPREKPVLFIEVRDE